MDSEVESGYQQAGYQAEQPQFSTTLPTDWKEGRIGSNRGQRDEDPAFCWGLFDLLGIGFSNEGKETRNVAGEAGIALGRFEHGEGGIYGSTAGEQLGAALEEREIERMHAASSAHEYRASFLLLLLVLGMLAFSVVSAGTSSRAGAPAPQSPPLPTGKGDGDGSLKGEQGEQPELNPKAFEGNWTTQW
eukprot:CAMPEP_0184480398 /NCGR_PEP_ID=MMETSP0113_2-20130426/1912_1 /TAXON_ID=91329 /ORGANISM="Norrisiella sphaerica, Strain BC52" /LENGTH=188 /DNA_ID=CAMNT_0026858863 /DNA_START=213 /DNA_END=776 /DNA_ORIENTATION=+